MSFIRATPDAQSALVNALAESSSAHEKRKREDENADESEADDAAERPRASAVTALSAPAPAALATPRSSGVTVSFGRINVSTHLEECVTNDSLHVILRTVHKRLEQNNETGARQWLKDALDIGFPKTSVVNAQPLRFQTVFILICEGTLPLETGYETGPTAYRQGLFFLRGVIRRHLQALGARVIEREKDNIEPMFVIPLHPRAYQGTGPIIKLAEWTRFLATLRIRHETVKRITADEIMRMKVDQFCRKYL